jgi:hypothetical protein
LELLSFREAKLAIADSDGNNFAKVMGWGILRTKIREIFSLKYEKIFLEFVVKISLLGKNISRYFGLFHFGK